LQVWVGVVGVIKECLQVAGGGIDLIALNGDVAVKLRIVTGCVNVSGVSGNELSLFWKTSVLL